MGKLQGIQSIRLEMVKHWLKYVTMAQRLLAMMDFLQKKMAMET